MIHDLFRFPLPRSAFDPELAKKGIDRSDVVSFDIFDTALLRPFATPDHLFWLLESAAARIVGSGSAPFRQLRIEGERQARLSSVHPEITLTEIYQHIENSLGLGADVLAPIMSLELELEQNLCVRRACIADLYDYAQGCGKRIFFTSDTYFKQEFIRTLLSSNGYAGKHEIIVSSEYRATKHEGALFEELRRRAGGNAPRLVHIGDNFRADCLMAWRAGIPSVHVPSPIHQLSLDPRNLELFGIRRLPFRKSVRARLSSVNAWLSSGFDCPDQSLLMGLSANRFFDATSSIPQRRTPFLGQWDALGYTAFGPLLLGFSLWLIECFRHTRLEKAFFLSRDGKIIKEAFDLAAIATGFSATATTYAWCSRRALNFARITSLDHQAMRFLCDSSSPTSVADHFSRIQFDADTFAERILAAGFSSPGHVVTPDDRSRLESLFRSLEAEILEAAAIERKNLLDYYHSIGLSNSSGVAVVDIGWWGTMYRSLTQLLAGSEDASQLKAYYFGTFAEADQLRMARLNHDAYFIRYSEPRDLFHGIKECIEIVELFFSATHGTFIRIERDYGEFMPLLDAADCTPLRIEAITRMQEGALRFMRDVLKIGEHVQRFRLSPYDLSMPLRTLLAAPMIGEIENFDSLVHYQDVGKNADARTIVTRPSTMQLLFMPWRFARQLALCYWRTGTIRRMPMLPRIYLRFLVRIREQVLRKF